MTSDLALTSVCLTFHRWILFFFFFPLDYSPLSSPSSFYFLPLTPLLFHKHHSATFPHSISLSFPVSTTTHQLHRRCPFPSHKTIFNPAFSLPYTLVSPLGHGIHNKGPTQYVAHQSFRRLYCFPDSITQQITRVSDHQSLSFITFFLTPRL